MIPDVTTCQGCAGGELKQHAKRDNRSMGCISVRNDGIAGEGERRTAESGVRILHMMDVYIHTCRHTYMDT